MLKFPFVCRLCLIPTSPDNSVEIFDETNEIPDKILELTGTQVLFGDGLPQEVCGVCRHVLDLSVAFKHQVCQADLMLREHLASTAESERCETPTITGDPLIEDEGKEKPPAEERQVGDDGKDQISENKPPDDCSNSNPSKDESREKEDEEDWAVAEPWPSIPESETVKGEIKDEQGSDNVTRVENCFRENQNMGLDETHIPITHIKLEGGGTLLFSLSEEEQEESTNSINDLDLSCSEVEEYSQEDQEQEEFKCPHCPKTFPSKRSVAGHQREHPEHSLRGLRRAESKRARDRERARDRKRERERKRERDRIRAQERKRKREQEREKAKASIAQNQLQVLDSFKENNNMSEENNCDTTIQNAEQISLGDDDSKSEESKDGPRRSSRSTLGKAPERHVVPHYSCHKCERMYNDEAALENHVKMQHEITYKCNHCGKRFTLKDSLERHIRNSHLDVTNQKIQLNKSNSNNSQTITNREQPKSRDRSRRNHNRPRRKIGHACDVCGKSFENRSHLFSHMRSHKSTVHLCEICGKTVSLNTYPAHKRAHLNAESHEIFPCDVCGKKFNSKIALRTHKTSYHGPLKFTCEVCGKQFTTMALMRHHQNIHSGKRDHTCQVCGKAFTLKVTLKSHMRIHTGEMPYGCGICGKHFTWKTTYRNHLATCKKQQNELAVRGEVITQNSVYSAHSDEHRNEISRPNVVYTSPPPPPLPMNIGAVPYMPQLPQELPLDYSEEAKYHAPIDYREESKYRYLPIGIPDAKGFPTVLNFKEDIKYPYQQPINFSGDVKLCRDVKSPM